MKQFFIAAASAVGALGSGPTRLEDTMPQLGFLMQAAQATLARDDQHQGKIVEAMRKRFETEMLDEEKSIGTALAGYVAELGSQRHQLEAAVNASSESLALELTANAINTTERTRLHGQLNSAERALKLSALRDEDALRFAQQQAGGLFEDLGQKLSTKLGDLGAISKHVEQLLTEHTAAVPSAVNASPVARAKKGITLEAEEVDAEAKAGKKYQDFFRKVTKEAYSKEARISKDFAAEEKLEVARLLTMTPVPAHAHRPAAKSEAHKPIALARPKVAKDEKSIAAERSATHKAAVKADKVAALDRLSTAPVSTSSPAPVSTSTMLKARKKTQRDRKAAAAHKAERRAAQKKVHKAAQTTTPAPLTTAVSTSTMLTTTMAARTTTMPTTTVALVTVAPMTTTTTKTPLTVAQAARLLGATTFQKLAAQKVQKAKAKPPQNRVASAMHKALRGRHSHHTK